MFVEFRETPPVRVVALRAAQGTAAANEAGLDQRTEHRENRGLLHAGRGSDLAQGAGLQLHPQRLATEDVNQRLLIDARDPGRADEVARELLGRQRRQGREDIKCAGVRQHVQPASVAETAEQRVANPAGLTAPNRIPVPLGPELERLPPDRKPEIEVPCAGPAVDGHADAVEHRATIREHRLRERVVGRQLQREVA